MSYDQEEVSDYRNNNRNANTSNTLVGAVMSQTQRPPTEVQRAVERMAAMSETLEAIIGRLEAKLQPALHPTVQNRERDLRDGSSGTLLGQALESHVHKLEDFAETLTSIIDRLEI